MLLLDQRARRVLVILIFIGVLANVLLDMLQTVGGYNSPLRFYAITNLFRPVGLFANSNHNAAFLYCALPFATAWAIGLMLEHRQNRAAGLAWLALLILMIIIGVAAHPIAGWYRAVSRRRPLEPIARLVAWSRLIRPAPVALCRWCFCCRIAGRLPVRICWFHGPRAGTRIRR